MFMATVSDAAAAQTAGEKRKRQLRMVSDIEDEIDQFIKRKPDASREEILRVGRIATAEIASGVSPAATPWEPAAGAANAAPAGLEAIWDGLTEEERGTVRTLLLRGVSVEAILREAEK